MAVAMFMQWRGVTQQNYDALREPVNWEGDPPAGLQFHAASFDAAGAHVFDIWESQEHAERFFGERLMPEVKRQGAMQGEPEITWAPLHAKFERSMAGATS